MHRVQALQVKLEYPLISNEKTLGNRVNYKESYKMMADLLSRNRKSSVTHHILKSIYLECPLDLS